MNAITEAHAKAARNALEELERHGDWEELEELWSLLDAMLAAHREDEDEGTS